MSRAQHSAFVVVLLPQLHKQPRECGPATFMTELHGPNPFTFPLPGSHTEEGLVPEVPCLLCDCTWYSAITEKLGACSDTSGGTSYDMDETH